MECSHYKTCTFTKEKPFSPSREKSAKSWPLVIHKESPQINQPFCILDLPYLELCKS